MTSQMKHITIAALLLCCGTAHASQQAKIETAQRQADIANCKVQFLKAGGGKYNTKPFFEFMSKCMPNEQPANKDKTS